MQVRLRRVKRLMLPLRLRHRRGHGVHSPFVYSIIRTVLMRRTLIAPQDNRLYQELIGKKIKNRVAMELQNLYAFCEFELFSIHPNMLTLSYKGDQTNKAIVVLAPYKSDKAYQRCREIIDSGQCVSIDNRDYMLFFYGRKQPVQHFKL